MRTILCAAALLFMGCFQLGSGGPRSNGSGTAEDDAVGGIALNTGNSQRVPVDEETLYSFLRSGKYKTFKRLQLNALGGAAHDASALRVFYNATLYASLTQGNSLEHPAQAAAVAERFDGQGNLRGWVVSVKVAGNSDGGLGWYWYAVDSTQDAPQLLASGVGLGLCSNCHAGGDDYVLSAQP